MARKDDLVEEARRRQQALLSRSSYFPAANLRQFEGTELSPPGAGTYYNPSRYAGAPASVQRNAARNLAGAYQSDLAFNAQANPRLAGGLEVERIGAQYGGGPSFAGRPGFQTVYGPSGGSAVVSDKVAKRMAGKGGYSLTAPPSPALAQSNLNAAYAKGYGAPSPTVQGGYLTQGGVANPVENLTPQQRNQFQVPNFGEQIGQSASNFGKGLGVIGQGLGAVGTLAYNAYNSLFNKPQPQQQPLYAGPPPQIGPRRYFDE